MVKARQPVTDPEAYTKLKTCTLCKETKAVVNFPLHYRKVKKEKTNLYRARCYDCHNAGLRKFYEVRKAKKALEVPFDGHLSEVNDGALINNENVEANNEK
jgi:hypothetical protein